MRDVAVKTATTAARRLARIEEQIARDAAEIAARPLGDAGSLRRALEALGVDEVAASTALAGIRLERSEITALLARGVALGGKQLTAYEAVADYADAAGVVASHEPIGPRSRRPFAQVDEVVDLHHRALRRTAPAPGAWRARNVPAVESGLVPPAHWLVPREIASFVDRYAAGPPAQGSRLTWVAAAHARILRIQPFDGGNGRLARLLGNLLLRRMGLPPAAFSDRLARRYSPSLAAADAGDLTALALLTAEAVAASLARLRAALAPSDGLRPLRELVPPGDLAALVKAAQRGRLRVVRRGARVYCTAAWIAEYRAGSASRAGERR